ncbi:unnamed protein product [Rhizophagus irregularis]|nr:unnamed protein product [Rhizophagus irregularis]
MSSLTSLCLGLLFIRFSFKPFSLRPPLGLSSLCLGLLFIRFSFKPFSLRPPLGLSSLYLGLLFIRSSFRPFSLRPPLGLLIIGFSFRQSIFITSDATISSSSEMIENCSNNTSIYTNEVDGFIRL